jgi:hypothetical protein
MAYASTQPENSLPARAAHKRLAAERREAAAARLRSEAAELDRRWREHVANREAAKQKPSRKRAS